MRIDNDFLTLMETIVLRIQRRDQIADNHDLPSTAITGRGPQLFGPLESDRLYLSYGRQIDALVEKINAADDADAAVAKQTAALTDTARKRDDALAKILEMKKIEARINEASRAIGQAMAAKDMDKAEALKAEVAALKKKLASMVEAKDAAPAPIDVKKWAFATGLTSTGYVQLFHDPVDALAFICRQTSPVTVTKVRDELAGNGCGADIYEVRWNVSPKDDGEGR